MKTRPKILFVFRKNARHPDRLGSIVCRITVRGVSASFATGINAMREGWSVAAHRLQGRSVAVRQANETLIKLEDSLNDLAADLSRQGKPVTAKRLVQLYQKGDSSPLSLLQLYDEFLAERRRLVGVEISKSSYELTRWRKTMLVNFLAAQRLPDLRPEEFTHNMGDKFVQWCLVDNGHKRNYANKALQVVGQCLLWGVRREHLSRSPLALYKYKTPESSDIKHLNAGQLAELTSARLPVECLRRVRDCFVFQCWTGLAYADMAALNVTRDAEYHRDAAGTIRRVLRVRRAKSTMQKGYECVIPLLPEAERILAQYSDKLPVPTNQVYNRYLKQIGDLSGYEEGFLTSHVGRKTAGVTMLNMGIRMETVSKFLGHSSVRMTEKVYAKILDTTVVDDFSKLFAAAASAPASLLTAHAVTEVTASAPAVADLGETRWLRPAPVTSHQATDKLRGGRVVPLWADEPSNGKEVAACG